MATYRDVRELYYGKDDMKIRDITEAVKEAKVERSVLMKWMLIGLGIVLLIAVGVWASKARAAGVQDVLCGPVDVSGGSLLVVILLGAAALAALVYLWARKTAHHPEYAAALEAKLDAKLRGLGLNTLADRDLVAKGQTVYTQIQALADKLDAEASALVEQARAKVADAKALRDRAGAPPA